MGRRVSYDEFEKASRFYWMKVWGADYPGSSNETKEKISKCKETIRLYRKQNRFNPYKFIDAQYKGYIDYGKKARLTAKIMFTLLFFQTLSVIFIGFWQDIAAVIMLSFMPVILVLLFMNMKMQSKYEKARDEYDYQKKYNPNFEREQKLKRILKNV